MSTTKKGLLTASKEWARHLRFKRPFWKGERQAGKAEAKRQTETE